MLSALRLLKVKETIESMGQMVRLVNTYSKGTIIVVLEHRDICTILDCKDATEQVNERFMDLYKMKSKPISSPDIDDPLKVLKIRFAEGEITKEQYEDMRKVLEL
jgi:ribosome maturation factor RimP